MPQESTVAKLYVSNLPYSWNDSDLKQLFVSIGKVTEARVIRDRDKESKTYGESMGYGFVTIDVHPHPPGHWHAMQGVEVDGLNRFGESTRRTLTVDVARNDRGKPSQAA